MAMKPIELQRHLKKGGVSYMAAVSYTHLPYPHLGKSV